MTDSTRTMMKSPAHVVIGPERASDRRPRRSGAAWLTVAIVIGFGAGDGLAQSSAKRVAATLDQFNTQGLSVPRGSILPGGPPKDGIPALISPHTVTTDEADFLNPDDRVVGVSLAGESRAYPINVLNWHEAVNDTLGGVPLTVIYCPLCDSVTVVDRRISADKTLEFGISGLLHNSNVLLYDRTDQALWSQIGLQAISGPHVGQSLQHLPFSITTFKSWRTAHPQTTVVSDRTGHRRNYALNPYERYFKEDALMFPVARRDDRLPAKSRVVGVRLGGLTRAYPLKSIATMPGGRLTDQIDGQTIVLEAGADGSVHVLSAPKAAHVTHTFWFAWAAFHPTTQVHDSTP